MAGSLEFINQTVVSAGTTSLDIQDVFSADYDTYFIVGNVTGNTTTAFNISIRLLDSGGTPLTSAVYDKANIRMRTDIAFYESGNTGQTSYENITIGDQAPEGSSFTAYLYNPYNSSSYTFMTYQSMIAWSGLKAGDKKIMVAKSASSYTGLRIYVDAQALGTGTSFSIFGVK